MINLFVPKHYSPEIWVDYIKQGFRVNRFLPRPAKEVDQMSAAEFLRAGWGEMLENMDSKIDNCCLASIIMPEGSGIIRLKCDEDYFCVTVQRKNQMRTIAMWQFTKCLEDYRLDELWTNLIKLENR